MIPPLQSLVKYDNAVLVSSAKDKGAKGKTATGKKVRRDLRVWDTCCMRSVVSVAQILTTAHAWGESRMRFQHAAQPHELGFTNLGALSWAHAGRAASR